MIRPNILITGTPGTGKTKLSTEIANICNYNRIDVSKVAKENDFIESYDKELDCPIIDEDKLLDHLESIMSKGGNIVEYHANELFPERWFQAVFVLRCDNTILYDRLKERGYNEQKLRSNVQCEIFQTILMEAMDSYDNAIVHELHGEDEANFVDNVKTIVDWIKTNDR